MQGNHRITFIVGFAIAILVMMVPAINITPAAYASGHQHHHHNHHHYRGHHHGHFFVHSHSSVIVNQRVNQANACDHSICTNSGSNDASVGTGSSIHGSSIIVGQSNNQANRCRDSICTNSATNDAN
jgi:hypothetical protein